MRSDVQAMLHQTVFPANILHVRIEDAERTPSPVKSKAPNKRSKKAKSVPRELKMRKSKIGRELLSKHNMV